MSISRNVYLVCGCSGDREEFSVPLYESKRQRDQEIWADFESELMFVSDGADTDMYGVMLGNVDAMHQELSDPIVEAEIRKTAKAHRQEWIRKARDFIARNQMMSAELKKTIQTCIKRAGDRQWRHFLFVEEIG